MLPYLRGTDRKGFLSETLMALSIFYLTNCQVDWKLPLDPLFLSTHKNTTNAHRHIRFSTPKATKEAADEARMINVIKMEKHLKAQNLGLNSGRGDRGGEGEGTKSGRLYPTFPRIQSYHKCNILANTVILYRHTFNRPSLKMHFSFLFSVHTI